MEYEFGILIADDEKEIVEAVKIYLYQLAQKFRKKIKIFETYTGSDVLEILDNNQIDLIFLDYLFENGINGDEIIRQISDPFGNKFIILMSGWREDEVGNIVIKNRLQLRSRFRFLRKPFEFIEVQDKFLEFLEFIESRPYPFPLQYVYDALQTNRNHYERIIAIKDFFETFIKYSVSILMSDLYRLEKNKEIDLRINLNQNLTYGAWLTWLDNIVQYLTDSPQQLFMPELLHILQSENKMYMKTMYEFKNLRDAELGHGFLQEEQSYAEKANKYFGKVKQLFDECSFICGYTLIYQEGAEILNVSSEEIQYQIRILMGSEIKPNSVQILLPIRLANYELYVYSPTKNLLSLNPYINYMSCPTCSLNRLYILDKILPNQLVYNAYCNHRLECKVNKSTIEKYFMF